MKRVLIIDDDPVVTSIYRNLLRRRHCEVATADNGDEGFKLAQRFRPDLILLDLDMPIAGGLQFLRRVRKTTDLRSIPIVVFTGSELRSRHVGAREAGATRVLSKLFEKPHRVLEAIGNAAVIHGAF